MTETDRHEVVVVGGGPAGMTTALYATRLGHDTAILDRGGGRAAMMADTHNVLAVSETTSGPEWLQDGWEQLGTYGTTRHREAVTDVTADGETFLVETPNRTVRADAVVLATGFADARPDPPLPRTGRGLHYCLHCDAYMFVDRSVYVMGHGDSAAHVAMIMLNFTDDVDLLLRDHEPEWSEGTDRQIRAHPVDVVEPEVVGVENGEDGWLESLTFADGTEREYAGGFAMYGSEYNTDLAAGLGCDLNDDGTVAVDDHGRTSADGVYAVGDVTPGHNQIPVALGEGARAGIGVHYDLREFPRSVAEIEEHGPVDADEVPGASERLREAAVEFRDGDPESETAVADD
jgi:thioredoxin reductase (NADPH)